VKSKYSSRILLGQLNSNGDCLYATVVAKQIKKDYPHCHLTWAIGSYCSKILANNPYIDSVWEIPLNSPLESRDVWDKFKKEAERKKKENEFQEIFLIQLINENYLLFDGTIRSSIYNAYPHRITVNVEPVLFLSEKEIKNVEKFVEKYKIEKYKNVILFECAPMTFQMKINPHIACKLSEKIISRNPDTCIILTSSTKIESTHPNIIDGSLLSLRENAELTKYCTLFIGCSSGITWICTSSWSKKLPMIQLLNPKSIFVNSVVNDHERWGLGTDHIVELSNPEPELVINTVSDFIQFGINYAKNKYHKKIRIGWHTYQHLFYYFLKKAQYNLAWKFVIKTVVDQKSLKLAVIYFFSIFRFVFIKLPRLKLKQLDILIVGKK
jgi:ADP-heptose:LPS heptosyltransferase